MSGFDAGNPMSTPPETPPPRQVSPPPVVSRDSMPSIAPESAVCLQCGYSVRGLDTSRNCPECGAPIHRSLMGNLLEFSSEQYVQTLHRGVVMIIVASILQVAVSLLAIIAAVAMIAWAASPAAANAPAFISRWELWFSVFMLPLTALLLAGWWMFSMPDPAILGSEKGQKPRLIIRITVAISAVMAFVDMLANSISASNPSSGELISGAAGLLVGIAGIVQFFASVLYVRWLAPRIPDVMLHQKTKTYLWLLPLIYVLGAICLGLGPLIALVMYLLMLNTVRVHLVTIMRRQMAFRPTVS